MTLYSSIFTRKSTRKFTDQPLSEEALADIKSFIQTIPPLVPDAEITYKIVGPEEVKGMGIPKAPHYFLIYGKEQFLRNTCAGFLFQHVDLYLFSKGYASRWLGMLKPKEADPNFIIGMAFGYPEKEEKRTLTDFDRKPLKEISEGTDSRLDAVRLAPSGLNGQPWYIIAKPGVLFVYRQKKINGLPGIMYKMTDLDVGIALCHLAVATEESGKNFNFGITKGAPGAPDGFLYLGTVT
ncbi:nitroreductase family protein [Enterococcus gilvus]|uniref:nitroreductase family protein n=1 Tax=Enterococcus gilvus TaxID=160453 RepID=UPI0029107194|nr:nitroreductase family protein [Enterococcus gilvus]MDU5510905.1 nitroreductase family protein [Enterococcus gilvus]